MNKRRLQPLEGTPHKKRKTNVHLDPWSSEEQSEVDMCSIEEEMMPMIHKVPIEILTLILDLCAWKDKIRLMQASRKLLQVIPYCVSEINFAACATRIFSQSVIEDTLMRCLNLQTLVLDKCKLSVRSRNFTQALVNLEKLRTLSVVGTGLPHSVLSQISELKNLKQLNLAGTMVTDKVLASMRDLSLTSLDIGQTPLKPKGKWPTYLTSMTSLQSLRLDVVPMKTVNCDFLLAFPDLHTLDLSQTDCQVMPTLSHLHQLRSLIFVHSTPQDPAQFAGHDLPPLVHLVIDLASIPAIRPLPSLKRLKLIDLRGELLDEFLGVTHKFPNLESLEMARLTETGNNLILAIRTMSHNLPNLQALTMDLTWLSSTVGKFDQHFSNMIAKLPLIKTLDSFYLRVFMEVDTNASVDIIWQSLVSVLIQQKTCSVLKEIPNCEIALVLKEGDATTGRSLVCRYKDKQWKTTKRWVANAPEEIKIGPYNLAC